MVTWPVYARLVRGQVLTIKEREYIQAARALGIPQGRILLVVACFNLLGDGLRDFLDPQLRGR